MADGHKGLNVPALKLVKESVVKGQTLLVGLELVAIGKDARPGNGEAVALPAHLTKEGNVLFHVVIVVNCHVAGVVEVGVNAVFGDLATLSASAHGHDIGGR